MGYVVQRKTGGVRGRPGRTTDETRWSCAGTLINNWYVLTAAHCQGKNPERRISKLRLGAWKVQGYGGKSIDKLPAEQNFDINEDDITKINTRVRHKNHPDIKEVSLYIVPTRKACTTVKTVSLIN